MQHDSPNNQQFFTAAMFELGIGLLAVFLSSFGGVHPHETMPKITDYTRLGVGWQVVSPSVLAWLLWSMG